MKRPVIILIILIIIGIGGLIIFKKGTVNVEMTEKNDNSAEVVNFNTSDGVRIVGDFLRAEGEYAVLLLHMMPKDRTSYKNFAKELKNIGISSLAIDLRGHGSSEGGLTGYQRFMDADHQNSIRDLEAASNFLEEQGFGIQHQFVVGASIGANLALQFAAEYEAPAVVLLSPGLDYKGIRAEPLAKNLKINQSILIAASEDDIRSPKTTESGEVMSSDVQMSRYIIGLVPEEANQKLIVYKNAGHGTDMFGMEEPDLEMEIIKFFNKSITNN